MDKLNIDFIDNARFNEIIRVEHYLHRANSTKPTIKYQITYEFSSLETKLPAQIVALVEWAAVFKPVLLRFPFLQHYEIVDNSRFLIRKEWELFEQPLEIYNLGSRSLSMAIKRIKRDWERITHTTPKLLITYVDGAKGYAGTVYKAANWHEIENSAGKNYNSKTKKDYKPSPKRTFVYPLNKTFHWQPVTHFTKEFLKENWHLMNPVAQYNYRPNKETENGILR